MSGRYSHVAKANDGSRWPQSSPIGLNEPKLPIRARFKMCLFAGKTSHFGGSALSPFKR
jgi:hypothetical protein